MTPEHVTDTRTLVWIDARAAVIVSWLDDRVLAERLESTSRNHRKSAGRVRHDSRFRHGGGGAPQRVSEPRREEHLNCCVERVAARLPADVDLLILGPGTTRERLERRERELEPQRPHSRPVTCEASAQRTDRQLIARLRHVVGADPRRRGARERQAQEANA
jgi:hypothetical protein